MVAETVRSWAGQEVISDRRARSVLGAVAFAVATWFGAYVAVPLPWTPVPMSLQPLFVILAGAMLGPRAGAASMALYLAVGASGAPVFALGGAGIPWLMGPTGGYLLAMPLAAWVVGAVVRGRRDWLRLLGGFSLGIGLIYLGGIAQLLLLTGQDLGSLLAVGVLPFLAGDVTKILAATLLARSASATSLGQ